MLYNRIRSYLSLLGILFSLTGLAQNTPRIILNPLGHAAKIQNLLFTPDGKTILSIAEDNSILLWDVATGKMSTKFYGQKGKRPEGLLYAAALSPDGKTLAVSGYTITEQHEVYISIINLTKGTQAATLTAHTNVVNCLAFSANGKFLFSGSDDGTIKIWKADEQYAPGSSIAVGGAVKSFSIHPSLTELAVAVEGKSDVFLYSLQGEGNASVPLTPRIWKKHNGAVSRVAYSGDGGFLASSSVAKEIFLWKSDGSFLKELVVQVPISTFSFSIDSKILVGFDDSGKGQSFGILDGNKLSDFALHDSSVSTCAFSPVQNGSYTIASAGGSNNEIYVWNAATGKVIRKLKGKGNTIHELSFGKNLELFVSHQGHPTEFNKSFDVASLKIRSSPQKLSVAPQSKAGATLVSEMALRLSSGKIIQNDEALDGRILDFAITTDGKAVVASAYSLKLYDSNGFLKKEFQGHTGNVNAVSISEDGRYLASGGDDQVIILWNLTETGAAPSLREAFPESRWANLFSALPMDSITRAPSKQAWITVMNFLKSTQPSAHAEIEEVYRNVSESISPFVTLFLAENNEWVGWTSSGYFAGTKEGTQYFGWYVSKGANKLAEFYNVTPYYESLYRPKQLQKGITVGKRVEEILKEEGEKLFNPAIIQGQGSENGSSKF